MHLLSIEHTDWSTLHDIIKAYDATFMQHQVEVSTNVLDLAFFTKKNALMLQHLHHFSMPLNELTIQQNMF